MSYKLHLMSYELNFMSYELDFMSFKLQVKNIKSCSGLNLIIGTYVPFSNSNLVVYRHWLL